MEIDVPKSFQRLTAIIERLDKQMGCTSAEIAAERKSLEKHVDAGFAEAAAARESLDERVETGFAEAAAARESLEERVETGFAEAAAARDAGLAEAAAARDALEERVKTGFAEAAADRKGIKQTIGELKGKSHEQTYRDKSDAIFGSHLRRGHKITSSVSEQLYDALDAGTISKQEQKEVLSADLLWGGRLHKTGEEVILVIEASWLAEETDVDRAAERAGILRKIGLRALPVVAAREWAAGIPQMASDRQVVMTTNGRIDEDSWQAAVDKRHPEGKQREWNERQVDKGD